MNVAGFPTLADTQEPLAVDTPTADLDRSSRENNVKNAVATPKVHAAERPPLFSSAGGEARP